MPALSPDALDRFARRAAAQWGFTLEPAVLRAWAEHAIEAPLEQVDAGLVLACGLFHRHPQAAGCFERLVAPRVLASIRKLGASPVEADEHLQATRTRLFVDDAGARLKTYRGQGTFDAFVTTVAVRAWFAAHQKVRVTSDDEQLARLPAAVDLERALARTGQQQHFSNAFREALGQLSSRERALLRLSLVDGSSIDELAPMYAVSRATVARWLAAARQSLQARTVAILSRHTQLAGADLDGLMASLESGFDLSLRRLVTEAADEGRSI